MTFNTILVYRLGGNISQNFSDTFFELFGILSKHSRNFYNFWNIKKKLEIFYCSISFIHFSVFSLPLLRFSLINYNLWHFFIQFKNKKKFKEIFSEFWKTFCLRILGFLNIFEFLSIIFSTMSQILFKNFQSFWVSHKIQKLENLRKFISNSQKYYDKSVH